jgi:hypothetical protein
MGLDWAWGGPCPYSGGCYVTGDLSYQSTQGWRLPTSAELALIPSNFAYNFVFTGANVPMGGVDPVSGAFFAVGPPPGAAANAVPYFTSYTWADWSDGVIGSWAGAPGDPYPFTAEQLYVRSVPEPGTLILLSFGVLGLIATNLRRIF